jgi:hypothetical protein
VSKECVRRASARRVSPRNAQREKLACASIPEEMIRLQAMVIQLDPLQLHEEMPAVRHHLAVLAAGYAAHLAPRHARHPRRSSYTIVHSRSRARLFDPLANAQTGARLARATRSL